MHTCLTMPLGWRQSGLSVSVRHTVCAPCRLNAPTDRRVLCGRAALFKRHELVFYGCCKERTVLKGAETRGLKEETRKRAEKTDVSLCSQAYIVEGTKMLGEGTRRRRGVYEEEIQLGYRRIRWIFNHSAVAPDVTVGLCERLATSERGTPISLFLFSSLAAQWTSNTMHHRFGRS